MATVSDFQSLIDWCKREVKDLPRLRGVVAAEILELGDEGTADITTWFGTLSCSDRPRGVVALSGTLTYPGSAGAARAAFDLALKEDAAWIGFEGQRVPAEYKEDVHFGEVWSDGGVTIFRVMMYKVWLWPTYAPVEPLRR